MRYLAHLLVAGLLFINGFVHGQTTISGVNPLSGGFTGFNPGSMPGLIFWVDASDGLTIDSTAGVSTISVWNDMSGNGNNATQVTKANQPTYVPNNLNGHPILRFGGTPVCMEANGVSPFISGNDTPNTFFFVIKVNVLSTGVAYAASSVASGTPLHKLTPANAAGPGTMIYNRTDDAGVTDTKTQGGGVAGTWYIESCSFNGTQAQVARNATTSSGSVNVGVTTIDTFTLCAKNAVGVKTAFLNADIAEVVGYNRALTALEISRITEYLNIKYRVF